MIVNIAIGNTDDKLTQFEWSQFWRSVDDVVRRYANVVHGAFLSTPNSQYQNASWTFEINDVQAKNLRVWLTTIRKHYNQDSVAWLQGETEFI